MAGGNNHAKQIVIEEAECLAKKLQNGNAGCAQTQGRAIALLVKMITPLYEAEFVTIEQCNKVHRTSKVAKFTRLKIGPVEIEGRATTALILNSIPLICCIGMFFVIGKTQGWW